MLGGVVVGEGVDGHHRRDAVAPDDLEVGEQVGGAEPDLVRPIRQQLGRERPAGDDPVATRVGLEGARRGDDDGGVGPEAGRSGT